MPKKLSKYDTRCTPASITRNYVTIRKDTPIPKQITTGSKLGDMALYRIPKIGKLIKAYNRIEAIGSEVLRLQQARDASCRKKKWQLLNR